MKGRFLFARGMTEFMQRVFSFGNLSWIDDGITFFILNLLIEHQGHLQGTPFASEMIELFRQLMQVRRMPVILFGWKMIETWPRWLLLVLINKSFDFKKLIGFAVIVQIRVSLWRNNFLFMIVFNDIERILDFHTKVVCLWIEAGIHLADVLLLSLLPFIELHKNQKVFFYWNLML